MVIKHIFTFMESNIYGIFDSVSIWQGSNEKSAVSQNKKNSNFLKNALTKCIVNHLFFNLSANPLICNDIINHTKLLKPCFEQTKFFYLKQQDSQN